MRKICVLISLLLLLPLVPVYARQASQYRCQFSDGQTLFPRYENNQIVLVSWQTGEITQVLADNIVTDQFDIRDWSEDCRFLVLGLGNFSHQEVLVFQVTPPSAQLLGRVSDVNGNAWVSWSPDQRFLILPSGGRTLLWDLPANHQIWVDAPALMTLTWDTPRNQLLAVPSNRQNGVLAIDLSSGQTLGFYHIGDRESGARGVGYLLNGDYILVAADHRVGNGHSRGTGSALWNRSTGWNIQLDFQVRIFQLYYDFELSPNGRYLVISRGGGAMYLWDLTALKGESPYEPNYSLHHVAVLYQEMTLRFIDDNTLEGNKVMLNSLEIYRWDIPSETQTYYDHLRPQKCQNTAFVAAYPEHGLLEWACGYVQLGE